MPYAAIFDATGIAPQQVGAKHPPGNKFPATVTGTDVKDVKDKTTGQPDPNAGKYFEVMFTTPAGSIRNNYNLWNTNKQAVDIAVGQLSALCHAVGIFKVDMNNDGAALRGAKCLINVGFQAGHEPSAEKPEGGYVEVKKVYDVNGNEPGKGPAPQASSGFTAGAVGNTSNAANVGTGSSWGAAANPNPSPNTAGNTANPAGGWQPGNNGQQDKPPWS